MITGVKCDGKSDKNQRKLSHSTSERDRVTTRALGSTREQLSANQKAFYAEFVLQGGSSTVPSKNKKDIFCIFGRIYSFLSDY